MKELPERKGIRLKEYDYSQAGYYFITICTKNREKLFGIITGGMMQLSEYGKIVADEILNISSHYRNVQIDKYVVMPNHIHMIIVISPAERGKPTERINPFPTQGDIPNIIGKYKAGVTRIVGNAFMRSGIWQPRYHDHIIRDEADYLRVWQYIDENPARWREDRYFAEGS